MRVKCIAQKTNKKYRFFLMMIVPLLIGLFIIFSSMAHAEWYKKDDPLKSPLKQGWAVFEVKPSAPSHLIKVQENPLKTAAR